MTPAGRYIPDGFKDKAPGRDARMRQDDGTVLNLAAKVQQIKIQAARRIGNGTLTAESRFDFMQKCQQRKGLKPGFDGGNRIGEWRVGRIGPGLCLVEGRNGNYLDPGAAERRQRRFQGLGRMTGMGRNIGPKAD